MLLPIKTFSTFEESNIIQNQTDHLSEDIASLCLDDNDYKKNKKRYR